MLEYLSNVTYWTLLLFSFFEKLMFLFFQTGDSSKKLLAWCSRGKNSIKVVELEGKQEEYASFEGVQLLNKGIMDIIRVL